jgi:hypothetical protein
LLVPDPAPDSLSRVLTRRLSMDLSTHALNLPAETRKDESSYGSDDSDEDDDGLFLRGSHEMPISREDFDAIILARKGMLQNRTACLLVRLFVCLCVYLCV